VKNSLHLVSCPHYDGVVLTHLQHLSAIAELLVICGYSSGGAPFRLKFALKLTDPPSENADFDRFPLITPQP